MEISNIATYPVSVPLVDLDDGGIAPYVTNHNELTDVQRVLVRVDTDEGVSGWGEMRVLLSPGTTTAVLETGIQELVVGRSPFEVETFRRQLFTEYTNVDPFFSAIEIACWDILGQVLDEPIYKLLGGWTAPTPESRERSPDRGSISDVEIAYCLGILPPDKSAEKAASVLDSGYSVLKTKAGRNWERDVDRLIAMQEAVDGQLEFRLDPNQGWTPDQAVRVAAKLEDAGVYLQYLEQPIRVDSHRELARLRQRTRQPIAPNEDTYIAHNLTSLVHAGAADAVVLDMTPVGGISGLRQVAAVAEDAGIPTTHHCAFDLGVRTAAILHAVSGIPGFSLPIDSTYYAWEGDVINDRLTVVDGTMPVPDGPGLGITVDPDKLDRYAIG